MKELKYIKVNNKSEMLVKLHNLVLSETNAGLVSLQIDRSCKKFMKELETHLLSSELQDERNRY